MYRIRIDEKSHLNVAEFIEATKPQSYVLVHHVLPHGNPHYHIFLHCDIKEPAMRQRIKRLGIIADDFSLKLCDPNRINEYIQYQFHRKKGNIATLIKFYNFDSELLHQLQIQAARIAEEFENNTTTKRNSKPTIYEFAKEVKDLLDKQFTQINQLGIKEQLYPSTPEYYEAALGHAIDVCHRYQQPFEENYLRRLVATSISLNQKGKQQLIDKIMRREFYHH